MRISISFMVINDRFTQRASFCFQEFGNRLSYGVIDYPKLENFPSFEIDLGSQLSNEAID